MRSLLSMTHSERWAAAASVVSPRGGCPAFAGTSNDSGIKGPL